jgi:hypothetical protein
MLLAALLVLPIGPAGAGTADDPEATDDCGLGAEAQATAPWTDLCAAWIDIDGDVLTVGLQVDGDLADRPESSYYVSWKGDDGCTHSMGTGDRSVVDRVPEPPNVSRSGDEGFVSFAVICDIAEYCDDYSCYDREWRAYASLGLEARTESGSTMTLELDLTEVPEVDDAYEHGDVLAGLSAESYIGFPGGLLHSDMTAPGRDYTIDREEG